MDAATFQEKVFGNGAGSLSEANPEYARFASAFAGAEVPGEPAAELPERERYLAILAALMGCQGLDMFRIQAGCALDAGLTPVEIQEVAYQGTAYLGLGRAFPFVKAVDEVLAERGIELPLEGQSTTTPETRLTAGNQKQIDYFGEGMRESWTKGAPERSVVNRWLADNCFGDYYTRGGLSDLDRELVTFCYIAAQGGCEPQLTSHAAANMGLGRTKDFMYRVVEQCLPYIGYPRSLNALACVDNAATR